MPSEPNLNRFDTIVDKDGKPTEYFLRFIQDRGGSLDGVSGTLTSLQTQINGKADKTIQIIAGTNMTGGGTLAADVTLNADASGGGGVGILPVVDGSIPPTFIQLDDGSLVFTEIL